MIASLPPSRDATPHRLRRRGVWNRVWSFQIPTTFLLQPASATTQASGGPLRNEHVSQLTDSHAADMAGKASCRYPASYHGGSEKRENTEAAIGRWRCGGPATPVGGSVARRGPRAGCRGSDGH